MYVYVVHIYIYYYQYIHANIDHIYIYIYISEVEGKKRSPRNREIGFVSFVRASVRACERAKLRDAPPAGPGELKMSSGVRFPPAGFDLKPQVCTGVLRVLT